MSEQEQIKIGQQLADILYLKFDPKYRKGTDVRYMTSWGNKTALGLYMTVKRILDGRGY